VNKEIKNHNSKGHYHGYQEWYTLINVKVWLRGNYKNNIRIHYNELHHYDKQTNFFIT